MPTYDYVCQDCGERFVRVQSMASHQRSEVSCPVCKSNKVERVFADFYAKTVRKS